MLDAWIIEELKRKQEEEDRKRENDNSLRIPIPEENPCLEQDLPVDYMPAIEIKVDERERN